MEGLRRTPGGHARRKGGAVNPRQSDAETLLTPSEVAALFRVDPKTVTRWAKAGKISSIRTLGGHRRYRESEVKKLLHGVPGQRDAEA
ncbi:MAG: BldC family transcriptional regulator [Actinomycetales bacterium]|nr:BldC family transcriptional regulator [Actinomycetales bacterium]